MKPAAPPFALFNIERDIPCSEIQAVFLLSVL